MATGGSWTLRRVLVGVLVATLLFCTGGVALASWGWRGITVDTVGAVDFTRPLAVPPLAPSRLDGQGRRVFELRAATGQRDFGIGGGPTATLGFNGDHLGPTLRAHRGEQVVINVHNGLDEPTSLHWHGMHLPAAMDGGPHQQMAPGGHWSPGWTVEQPAATLWYHPHPHGQTGSQVYRGLAGLFLIDDEATDALALPDRYGVDDIPLIVQDRRFHSDGSFDEGTGGLGGTGVLGDTLLVNGTVGPYLEVRTERVRLRLLNGSNARVFDFGFADDRRFALVGTDGGLLAQPYATSRVRLSPGERAEIVVDLRAGERTVLRSYPPRLGVDPISNRFTGGDDQFDVLQLRAADTLAASPPVPATLARIDRIDPADSVRTRQLRLTGRKINGRSMDLSRIDATVTRGSTEIWEVVNSGGTPHNFHLHATSFQVLPDTDGRLPAALSGWKDTVYLEPNQPVRLIVRFPDHPDPDLPYMFHCHLLYHEDRGMMGQFVLVEPGQQAGHPPVHEHPGHD